MARDELTDFDEEMELLDREEDSSVYEPIYKMISDNKIPVSKKEGAIWKSRLSLAESKMKNLREDWEVMIKAYKGENRAPDDSEKKMLNLNQKTFMYENLVWSNTNGLSRETIMKVPYLKFTGKDDRAEMFSDIFEKAINKYMNEVGNNGRNVKEKLSKVDILAQLTNRGIWRLDWNDPVDKQSVEQAIKLKEAELVKAKDTDKIKEIEGELYALNEKLESSGFSGAQITLVDPSRLFIDPNSQLESGLDADWIIEERIEYESIIKAKYGNENGTVYAKDKADVVTETYNDIIGEEVEEVNNEALKTVTTYYIWDKVKKRLYLYQKDKWDYPLWVWDDPYGLKQFFPYFILNYNTNPVDAMSNSEVYYYMPMQNEINKINSQICKARDRAFNSILYNTRADVSNKDLNNISSGKEGFIKLNLPDGMNAKDVFTPMPTPAVDNPLIMNKSDLYQMISKTSSADSVTRGEEYKTNTTNLAIQQYSNSKRTIIGIRIDKLVSFYKRVCIEILRLMIARFSIDDWLTVLDFEDADMIVKEYPNIDTMDIVIAGDDTLEPTSAMKKQEAIQIAQIMGQFASATPMISIVMLKMLSKAFNDVVVTQDDWNKIFQSMNMMMQQQSQQGMPVQQQQVNPIDMVNAAVQG